MSERLQNMSELGQHNFGSDVQSKFLFFELRDTVFVLTSAARSAILHNYPDM